MSVQNCSVTDNMTSNRILELAKQFHIGVHANQTNAKLEAFYKAAHADGQRAMRERAAKALPMHIDNSAIRNLEITE